MRTDLALAREALRTRFLDLGWQEVLGRDADAPGFTLLGPAPVEYGASILVSDRWALLRFQPLLGVRYPEISDLRATFNGLPPSPGTGVLGAGLESLMPLEQRSAWLTTWAAANVEDIGRAVDAVVDDVIRYSPLFFTAYKSLQDIVEALRARSPNQMEKEALAIALALSGEEQAAIDAVGVLREMADGQQGRMQERTRAFVRNLVAHFGLDCAATPLENG